MTARQVASETLVEARSLSAGYGRLKVLDNVSLSIARDDYLGVAGHNGAGKSTLLAVLAGLLSPWKGEVELVRSSSGSAPATVVLVPQGHAVFPHMKVSENLEVPWARAGRSLVSIDAVLDFFPILRSKMSQHAGNLSGGEQQALAIAMGLRMAPDVLLLDEPSLGLAPVLVHQIMEVVDDVRKEFGFGVVVVEQNMQELLVRARDLLVMSRGAIVWTGKPGDLKDTRDLWKFF
jgi:branched-chain amino acid transport system ATP-binding protein